jgi:hypothetical protein
MPDSVAFDAFKTLVGYVPRNATPSQGLAAGTMHTSDRKAHREPAQMSSRRIEVAVQETGWLVPDYRPRMQAAAGLPPFRQLVVR